MKKITFVDSANSVSLMEWNVKTSLHWDWENLVMLNASTTDMPQKLRPTVWGTNGGLDSVGSIYSLGAGGSSGTDSVLGLASLSKSSKSALISSSSMGDCKGNKFKLDGYQGIPNDFSNKKDFAKVNPPVEVSVGSSEPLLDLKLGKRTYSEDVSAEKNAKSLSSSVLPASSVVPAKRTKVGCQTTSVLRCQVEGCDLDLSSAKDYHRKHRVCENHAKSPKVIVAGLERRFCQQCSRFHSLSEFDEKKRSCRRRLSDHNARRRRPKTASVAYNAARLSVSPYDAKHEISFVWNRSPFAHTRPHGISWEGMFGSKSTPPMKSYTPTKVGSTNEELQLPGSEALKLVSICNPDSSGFILPNANHSTTDVLHQDVEESTILSSTGMPQDLHRALSLLSTDSWGSCEPKQGSLDYSMPANDTVISQPAMHTVFQGFPLALSNNWQIEQPTALQVQNTLHNDGDNHVQEFQLFRSPYGRHGFYPNRIN